MLSVIFRNLLSNAIKFSNQDGSIFFDAQVLNHQAIIKITDQGVGISEKLIEQFNAEKIEFANESNFGTNNEKGTGLGLFLIKNFAKESEAWYALHQQVFRDTFKRPNPVILYSNAPDFQQTTAISG